MLVEPLAEGLVVLELLAGGVQQAAEFQFDLDPIGAVAFVAVEKRIDLVDDGIKRSSEEALISMSLSWVTWFRFPNARMTLK